MNELPNSLPRPPGEFETLKRLWSRPRGLRAITVINNNYVGMLYVGAAFLFFVLAGILALLMRTQLAVPDNTFMGSALYNQLFTMHGTMMMFLFAVPAVEAMGVLLLPNMLGARDLPFPRLSAYAFWAYFVGGMTFFCSIFFGLSPTGGWFMYPPLTTSTDCQFSERIGPRSVGAWLLPSVSSWASAHWPCAVRTMSIFPPWMASVPAAMARLPRSNWASLMLSLARVTGAFVPVCNRTSRADRTASVTASSPAVLNASVAIPCRPAVLSCSGTGRARSI